MWKVACTAVCLCACRENLTLKPLPDPTRYLYESEALRPALTVH
jgi:hypothetical protein